MQEILEADPRAVGKNRNPDNGSRKRHTGYGRYERQTRGGLEGTKDETWHHLQVIISWRMVQDSQDNIESN